MSHRGKRWTRSTTLLGNLTGILAVLILPIIPPDARPWLVAVLLANALNRFRIRVPITLTAPGATLGGTTFTGVTSIEAVAGGDIGTVSDADPTADPPD